MINLISYFLCTLCFFALPSQLSAAEENALFAGGCFWCLEHDLEHINGVISVESGYAGGTMQNPTYREHQGHQEAVKVLFDPKRISYEALLQDYWKNIDPFDGQGQFCDKGDSYRPLIFPVNSTQEKLAINSISLISKYLSVQASDIKVEIKNGAKFWLAEDYHQDYAIRNKLKYNFYRSSCGRDKRLEKIWNKG